MPYTAAPMPENRRASATMAVHAAMQKMMPKFTESSTETSVAGTHTTKAATVLFGGTLDVVTREGAHPAGNK